MDATKSPGSPESKLHFLDYWRIIRIRKTIILVVFLLVVITVTAVTLSLTPLFQSAARIRVEKDAPALTPFLGAQSQSVYDPYYLATEFEVLKSTRILNKVIERLDLRQKYAERAKQPKELEMQAAYEALLHYVDVAQDRNTSLIKISGTDRDPQLAADIANAVAEVYQDYRSSTRSSKTGSGLETLTNKLAELNLQVEVARKEMENQKRILKIPDLDSNSSQMQNLQIARVARLEESRNTFSARLTQNEAMLSKIKSKKGADLREFLAVARPTGELSTLIGNLNQTEQRLVAMNPDFGPEHPEYKRIKSLLDKVNAQIDAEVKGIVDSIDSQIEADRNVVTEVEHQYDEALAKLNQQTADSGPYVKAKKDYEAYHRVREALLLQITQEDVNNALYKQGSVEILDRAIKAAYPVKPSKTMYIGLGSVLGLMLGLVLAFFIEYLDTSVKTIDDVEHALGAPVLGVIPQNVGALIHEGPDSPHAEAYRVLRTNILFSRKDPNLRTMTVVSGGAGEGKSTTIFNLATVFAQQGSRVLVVDSDLRRPSLHKLLNVANNAGLTNYLLKQNKLEEVVQTTAMPNLDFLPSGKLPSSSLGILNSVQMKDFIQEAKNRYDFVFFDSPPIMGVSDASVLASEVDMAVLVVQYRKYPQQMTLRAKQMVEKVGGPGRLLGVVLNNINISQDSYYYYYSGYYYDYYSKSEDSRPDSEKKPAADKAKKPGLDLKQKY